MATACITFDQPLWIKTVEIVQSSKLNVVCRLGGFHVIMRFFGSIGKLVEGSGFADVLQSCYGVYSKFLSQQQLILLDL